MSDCKRHNFAIQEEEDSDRETITVAEQFEEPPVRYQDTAPLETGICGKVKFYWG